jgi:hypothetical protein
MKIIKNFIEFDFVEFIQDYLSIKINSNQFDQNSKKIEFGYSFYSDFLIETILQNCCENISKEINYKIFPSYSLTKVYSKNEILTIEENSNNCDYCGIIFLGFSNDEINNVSFHLKNKNSTEEEILLNVGDLLFIEKKQFNNISVEMNEYLSLYSFLYFVSEDNLNHIYDGRPYLGFPKNP